MQKENNIITNAVDNLKSFIKWITIASVIGFIVGIVCVCFHFAVEKATELRIEQPWLLWLLPFGGVLIIWLYKKAGMEDDKGTNCVLEAIRENTPLTIKTAPLIFVSTVITHLFGGSSGREGAALQIGGSISSFLSKYVKLDENDQRIITMCGMSAGFSALFGTPLAAFIFAMEVEGVGVMYYAAAVPCIIASVVGGYVASLSGIMPTAFNIVGAVPIYSFSIIIKVAVLGVACAAISMLFCRMLKDTHHLYNKIPNKMATAFLGGVLVIILTYIVGTRDYNGAGIEVINRAVNGDVRFEAFLLKMIFTAITLEAGFKGGEIVPSLFIGATFGSAVSSLFALEPSFAAGLGMAALFCGVTNCPITSIILSIELFGTKGAVYYAIICAVSYRLSGYYGLYNSQKIVYSKDKHEFIDKKTV